ncbi:MAG: carboxy terminal-processing peptidase [Bacteroidales bacterium]|nr:carboxy terminal-processing peptidase [Bacteroidales bacterium]
MHRKFSVPALALIFLAMLASYTFCQRSAAPVNQNLLLQLVTGALDYAHYSPPRLDDEFSANLFETHLKAMDYNKQFFTAEDMEKFEPFKNQLDDEIKAGRFDFYQQVLTIYQSRLKQVEGFYKELLSNPLDLNSQEVLETDAEKTVFAENDMALKDSWRKILTYQVMTRVQESLNNQKAQKSDTVEMKTLTALEAESRSKVEDLYKDFFTRLEQRNESDYMSIYINAITSVFDPHTQYLPPQDKENFDISMSGQFEGIGATLQENEGYIKVVDLVPGSPSWLQGKMKINDLITKVRQAEEVEPMDVYGMRIDDVVKKIRGKKGTTVVLTVKHVDGSIEEIPITRDVIIMEETYAKSAILRDTLSNDKKIGYINLPKFYVDFNNIQTGRSCADDVAAELEKLKAENVSGIILDLRNNGGGSLPDAVKMAGLFIPKGPIVQVSQRNGRKQVLSDTDPKVQYDGNLIILVNPLSASASEILAAAMQDYKRAIIMGSSTTFGKGTVQTVVDLNDLLRESSQDKENVGSMLITIQKFFRINGGSTQLKGVRPDIVMPDLYSEMQIGERQEDFPLPWTEIDPASYTMYDKNETFAAAIQESKARIDTSKNFSILREQMELLRQQRDDSNVPLNLDLYTARDLARKEANKKLNEMNARMTSLNVSILSADALKVGTDTVKISRNATWINSLEKDVYLEEAVRVLESM